MATIEERLQMLEDKDRIRELRATYCFLVDDLRLDELVERCFTEDASCDFRSLEPQMAPIIAHGREEVRQFFTVTVPSTLRAMCHTIHNERITVEGDRANGDCYFELTASDAATGRPLVGAGRYVDRYRRVGGEWRFEARNAEVFFIVPLGEGWKARPQKYSPERR